MHLTFIVVSGPQKGETYTFSSPGKIVIGRSKKAELRIGEGDPYVSRQHAIVEIDTQACTLINLSSKNPISVNGIRIKSRNLHDGDTLEVGYTKLKVIIDSLDEIFSVITCRICHREVEVFSKEEAEEGICFFCRFRKDAGDATRTGKVEVRCVCGEDLTARANSDGRANELLYDVKYACKQCVGRKFRPSGLSFGPYQILRKLGSGLFGNVYLTYHEPTARLLVLKVMSDLNNRSMARRFEREIFLLRSLKHKYLIRYVDSSRDEAMPFLVMAYADSGSLAKELYENGPLHEKRAVEIISRVLEGMAFMHENKITHRDIKPDNILLHSWKGEIIPKITDFGIAKQFSRYGGSILTKSSQIFGTPFFMSPEQIMDFRNVRESADLYSVGVTLYYILSGKIPFNYPSPYEIEQYCMQNDISDSDYFDILLKLGFDNNVQEPLHIVIKEDPLPIEKKMPDIHPELAGIINKSISKLSEDRFQTSNAFREALEDYYSSQWGKQQ